MHTLRFVLASRIGSVGLVPYCLAAFITLPDPWNRCSWGVGAGVGGRHAARQIAERTVSDLKIGFGTFQHSIVFSFGLIVSFASVARCTSSEFNPGAISSNTSPSFVT